MTPPSAATGPDDGLAAVLTTVLPQVRRYARGALSGEPDLVEEFVQDAIVDLIEHHPDAGGMDPDEVAVMLQRSIKYDVMNHWSKQNRRRTSTVAVDNEVLLNDVDPDSGNEILAMLGRLDHERLLAELPRLLTGKQRRVIVAVDVLGLSQPQAARQLGMSLSGLEKLRARALTRLREHLGAASVDRAPSTSWEIPR
ncbi:RNA polymerase sigma factor [Saccharothrix luteola]|uniref:RNA polymerase sigma factor n=1 Tax=Saccharothrix luteola TaxID=2893018 RepID=UPI001E4ED465|nr:RNA polymerase sigma factor [Saccharothrix luteola]MCC8247641.1 RNA polymerase sigma factor [Saccharothrix luteola]